MDPWSIGLTAGASALSYLGQREANATNVRLAREQMKFQERMSGSAMQRHRADLEAAGFNPMLAVGGSGASSPVGASARVENAPGAGVTSGLAARQQQAQIALLNEQSQKTRSEEMKVRAEVALMNQRWPMERDIMEMDAQTRRALLPYVAQHMSSETARNLSSALEGRSHSDLLVAERILKEFEFRHAKNLSDAQRSWWMRNVNPYLSSAGDAVRVGTNVATPLVIGRGARAIQNSSRQFLRGVQRSGSR